MIGLPRKGPGDLFARSRAEPRRGLALAAGCVFSVFAGSSAFAQQATQSHINRMTEIARDTCLATFPSYNGIERRLATKGLSKDELGTWRGPATIVVLRKTTSSFLDCEVWMPFDSDTRAVSDTLQTALPRLGVAIKSAKRRGVRVSAAFQAGGFDGMIRTEPMSGRTSKIVVSAGRGS